MPVFTIPLRDLEETSKSWSFEVDPSWIGSTLADAEIKANHETKPGELEVMAQLNGADALVQAQLNAQVLVPCARCLGDVKLAIATAITALLSPEASRSIVEEVEIDPSESELYRDYYSGPDLILDDLVREHIVLEVPMKPLCSEDCRGISIPAHIRGPSEVLDEAGKLSDPRLAPLLKLKQKLAEEDQE